MRQRPPLRRTARLGAVAAIASAVACAALAGPAGAAERPPSLLVKLADGRSAASIAAAAGLVPLRDFPEIGWTELGVTSGDPAAAARRLLDSGLAFRVDYQRPGDTLGTDLTPRDAFVAQPLNLGGGITSDYHWLRTNFYPAWDAARGGVAARIAVVDSEFDTEHDDLKTKFTTGFNAESGTPAYRTSNVRATAQQIAHANANPNDQRLHGTHVAGLAGAATDNGIGVAGAGFDTVVMPVKVSLNFQVGDTIDAKFVADAVEGIRWAADNGASVINMSFGTPRFHQSLLDAVNHAASKGVMLVGAAGNTQADPNQRGTIQYPAAFPNVLAVAATDHNNQITNFSTNGDFVDVAAPGANILSTWDVRAPGITINGQPVAGYRFLNGTSMASPIVAGLAGLIRNARPDLTPAEVEAIITSTATDLGAIGKDPVYGHGLINADRAVRAALAYVRPGPPPRAPVRFFYSCTIAAKKVVVGKRGRTATRRGVRLVCKGRTQPAVRNATLEVQRLAKRRGWFRIATFRTNNRGRFGFTVRLRTLGNWTIRPAFGGNAALAPAGGLQAKVVVRPRR